MAISVIIKHYINLDLTVMHDIEIGAIIYAFETSFVPDINLLTDTF